MQKTMFKDDKKASGCARTNTVIYPFYPFYPFSVLGGKINKMAGSKLSIRNTSIYEQWLIKLWGRYCISNPIIEPFLEIISFKKFAGILIASGSYCLIQTGDLIGLRCWLSKDFCSNIMSSQIKQVVSKKILNIHFYFFFHHSYRALKCYSKSQSLPQGTKSRHFTSVETRNHQQCTQWQWSEIILSSESPSRDTRSHPIHTRLPSPQTCSVTTCIL